MIIVRGWKKILSEQLLDDAGRLSVEDATILYEEADINLSLIHI